MIHQCYLKTIICNTILTFAMSTVPCQKLIVNNHLTRAHCQHPRLRCHCNNHLTKATSDQNIVNIPWARNHCQHLLTKTTMSTYPVKTSLLTTIAKRSLSITKLTRTLLSTFRGQELTV
ncbi:hypothetical protein NP493_577g01018 [Ridgeia piscesae]|uniref:Secreted protein n=1 Tax=Ridgeia piscesae TaxID=27915 RepID=A0AAD9NSH9_RIDPI|nr:hypothetical protein NP493_577g01018 [Ridgeia piscesae]